MPRLRIRHETRYQYQRPVSFGAHRLMLRPRDGHSLRLLDASLELSPPGSTRWIYDALSNCVCWFQPQGEAPSLRIVSNLLLDTYPALLVPVDDPHSAFPVVYDSSDMMTLAPFIMPVTQDEGTELVSWLRSLVGPPLEPVLSFVQRMNQAIHDLDYRPRYEEGVQTPAETLAKRSGTCRDFAWLMVEALRRMGFAARFVSGYIYSPHQTEELRGAGQTHAWCEIFLPSMGWIHFDPTNGLAESPDLIAVAVARTPTEAAPVKGIVIGDPGGSELNVSVSVDLTEEAQAQAA